MPEKLKKSIVFMIALFSVGLQFHCSSDLGPVQERGIVVSLNSYYERGVYFFNVTNLTDDPVYYYQNAQPYVIQYRIQMRNDSGWVYCDRLNMRYNRPNTILPPGEARIFSIDKSEDCPTPWRLELYFFTVDSADTNQMIVAHSGVIKV